MDRSVHRRTGRCQNAGNAERGVVMAARRDFAETVGDDDVVTGATPERPRDFRTEDGIEDIAESDPFGKDERLALAVAVVAKIFRIGPDDAKAAMTIAEGKRHGPGDIGMGGDPLCRSPEQVRRRVPDTKDRIKQKRDRPTAGTDDEIGAGNRAGKPGPCLAA